MQSTGKLRLRIGQLLLFLCLNFGSSVYGRRSRDRGSRSAELQGVVESGNLFAQDLYKAITHAGGSNEDRNVFISPLSLDISLAMLRSGAAGLTKKEITRGLRLSNELSDSQIHNGYKSMITTLKEDAPNNASDGEEKDVVIQVANRIFVGQEIPIKSSFLQTIRENFGADAEQLNFGQTSTSAATINRWIKKETRNKIKDIVVPSMLNNHTVMVLANAIHFKGQWKHPFSPDATSKKRFTTVAGFDTQVEMMQLDNPVRLQYGKLPELRASSVAMPYADERYSYIIVLPDQGENLKDIEARMQDGALQEIPTRLNQAWVDIRMPKGILESTIDLIGSKAVKMLGMNSMTTLLAEFDNLTNEKGVHVSNIIHKAFLDVNEAGSEAAAASAIVAKARSLEIPEDVVKFTVDRPFLSFIYDAKTRAILFIGRKLT